MMCINTKHDTKKATTTNTRRQIKKRKMKKKTTKNFDNMFNSKAIACLLLNKMQSLFNNYFLIFLQVISTYLKCDT